MKVTKNSIVTLEYVLMDDKGEVLESSNVDGDYDYLHGIGEMLPGVEKALDGLEKGARIDIVVPPEEGFGIKNDDLIVEIEKEIFPEDSVLEAGMEFDVEDEDGDNIITIIELRGNKVLVDKNHPLAGETLRVKAEITEVRMAEDWELEHWGHHHDDHEHCEHDH